MHDNQWPGWSLIQSGISAVSGLLGVVVGAFMTALQHKKERQNDRLREQLEHFYSPLIGLHAQIVGREELGRALAQEAFKDMMGELPNVEPSDPSFLEAVLKKGSKFQSLKNFNEEQFRKELVPLYAKIADLFSKRMWLAEPSTLKHYNTLLAYVELWSRKELGASSYELDLRRIQIGKEVDRLFVDLSENFTKMSSALKR